MTHTTTSICVQKPRLIPSPPLALAADASGSLTPLPSYLDAPPSYSDPP